MDSMDDGMDQQLIAEFLMVTGEEDTSKALQMLQATGNDLQAAVELYFAAGADVGNAPAAHIDDTQDQVRAPIPTKVDRLYGEEMGVPRSIAGSSHERSGHGFRSTSLPHQPIMDAFRLRHGDGSEESEPFSSMFEPPRELLFNKGNFENAKEEAQNEHKWIIVNIQSPSSFDSHRLNRDTWRDGTIQALLPTSFVLYQTYDVSEEGQEMMAFYNVDVLPTILIVDPMTGAPMKQWHGFVDAAILADGIVPFMDTPFDDPGAARLAASSFRRKYGGVTQAVEAPITAPQCEPEPVADVEQATPEDDGAPETSPELIAEEAFASLPPEETADTHCRIALRMPDGKRIQRRFPKGGDLSLLHTWCVSQNLEAAGGRPFVLSQATPGSQPLQIHGEGQTIEEAGIADCMLQMRWEND